MPRNYAQIMCSIWDEEAFLALSESAQRGHFMLTTQPDISAAGVLRMWTPRWVALSRTSTDETLKAALSELKQAGFVVPDWVTGELLVTSFVRTDGGYKNSKRKPVILREARTVRSAEIKARLRIEFESLGLDTAGLPGPPSPSGPDGTSDRASDRASDVGRGSSAMDVHVPSGSNVTAIGDRVVAASTASRDRSAESEDAHVDRASDVAPHTTTPSNGVVVTNWTTGEPTTHNQQTVPPPAGDEPTPDNRTEGQILVSHWIDQCRKRPPGNVIGQAGKLIAAMLDEGISFDDIQAGIDAWSAKGLHPSALPAVVNEVMNARPHLRLASGGGPQRIATTTQRFQAALAHLDPEEP